MKLGYTTDQAINCCHDNFNKFRMKIRPYELWWPMQNALFG